VPVKVAEFEGNSRGTINIPAFRAPQCLLDSFGIVFGTTRMGAKAQPDADVVRGRIGDLFAPMLKLTCLGKFPPV
jgi:hypothetical protein